MDNFGISETRWTGAGMIKERSEHTPKGYLHPEGVDNIMSDKATKASLEWKPLGERLLMARFNSNCAKLMSLRLRAHRRWRECNLRFFL